jgi:hypothetical protein
MWYIETEEWWCYVWNVVVVVEVVVVVVVVVAENVIILIIIVVVVAVEAVVVVLTLRTFSLVRHGMRWSFARVWSGNEDGSYEGYVK